MVPKILLHHPTHALSTRTPVPNMDIEQQRQPVVDSDNELEGGDVQEAPQTRVVDADFFNTFADDFDESDMHPTA